MYKVRKINERPNDVLHKEFLVDYEADIQTLPTNIKKGTNNKYLDSDYCAIGSEALCLENKSVYILGNDSVWHKL